jgi:hypothetical protein
MTRRYVVRSLNRIAPNNRGPWDRDGSPNWGEDGAAGSDDDRNEAESLAWDLFETLGEHIVIEDSENCGRRGFASTSRLSLPSSLGRPRRSSRLPTPYHSDRKSTRMRRAYGHRTWPGAATR